MTSIGRKTCLESLEELTTLSQQFEDKLNERENARVPPFPQFRAALGSAEGKFCHDGEEGTPPTAIALWRAIESGRSSSPLPRLVVDRLCAIPHIAMSQEFLSFLQAEKPYLSEWGLTGLVRSYHQVWGELLNRFGVVEAIRSRFVESPEPRSPRLRVWRANLRSLVDANDVDNLSLEAIAGRLTTRQLNQRFSIDEDSAFMSSVIATSIRRICQKHRSSAEDIAFLADCLLGYDYFRPRDLGRALSNVISLNHGQPAVELRAAIKRIIRTHSVLGPLPQCREQWFDLVGEAAVATIEKWPEVG